MTDSTIPDSKVCRKCDTLKPFTEFYLRSDCAGTFPGHYNSECKACMKLRNRIHEPKRVTRDRTTVRGETLAIEMLRKQGIYTTTGKAVYAADTDLVAFGCVWIEVKHAKLKRAYGDTEAYTFVTTPSQIKRGLKGHIVMLVCEDHDEHITYHLFPANHPVFYKDERLKTGMVFTPGITEARKHGNNRVVMTQPMMDAHQDNWQLVWDELRRQCEQLKSS